MKKILAITLSAIACLSVLTACGDGKSSVTDSGYLADSAADSDVYDDSTESDLTDRVKDGAKDAVSGGADIVDDAASAVGDVARDGANIVGDAASTVNDVVSEVAD
ncbi:MAG: hypothetical protein IJH80_05290 [Ruminococcus sp.]|nr:hypothetical protein [Ruminococcus sp.]